MIRIHSIVDSPGSPSKLAGVCRFVVVLIPLLVAGHLRGQIDRHQLLGDLQQISSDEFAGRATGANEKARQYIMGRIDGLQPVYPSLVDTFGFLDHLRRKHSGYNIVGKITGNKYPDKFLVLSAHYDHLGIVEEQVYNGADDNGSGTCALIGLVDFFQEHTPRHSIIFAFFDAEELGLKGADRFVEDPPVPLDQILINVNMDMISRSLDETINICGIYDFPKLKRIASRITKMTDLNITLMHEGPRYQGSDNWTMSSDHGMFLRRDIPFLYFGVEDHPDYHMPTDDFEFVNEDFYYKVVTLVKDTVLHLDKKWKKKRRAKRIKGE